MVLAWSTAPAAVYAAVGLLHAAVIERTLTVDVAFGRSLSFWVGTAYLALPLWGFLPRRPAGWYARRGPVSVAALVGLVGALACAVVAALWLAARWNPRIGGPVAIGLVILVLALGLTVWLASRDE